MSEYVEFSVDSEARLQTLRAVLAVLQSEKRGETHTSTAELEALFGSDAMEHFDRPGAAARERRREDLKTKPVIELATSDAPRARWDFDSLIHGIMEGDYDLIGCDRTGDNRAQLKFFANGYPYGGVGALVALLESFGFNVTGIEDGTGYVAVSRGER